MQIRLRCIVPSLCLLLFSPYVFADGTRTWEQSKFEEFIKGTPEGIAICSSGRLELAPAFSSLYTSPSSYIWAIASDREGVVYAAAGSPARVYRITPDEKSSVIFESQELQVQALTVDKTGAIYAATNPDGKIYKIENRSAMAGKGAEDESKSASSGWTSSIYFDPKEKYIWDLALDRAGNLYVATGDHGEILKVAPKGEHSVFFKSDEAHIRVLAFDAQENLIAGSDGSGLVYRISPKGEGFVLYSAPRREITALAIDKAGNIYAAGVGEKHAAASAAVSTPIVSPSPAPSNSSTGIAVTPSASSTLASNISLSSSSVPSGNGSDIYRIAADGSPTRIWSSHDDLVYALAFDQHGQLLAGTGNRGHIFAISGEDEFTDLVKASATQVTAFAPAPNGGLYASTSNLGKVFFLSASPASQGSYQSDVFDARIFSRWGRAELRSTGDVKLFARSGNVDNPDRNWSAWKEVDLEKDGSISAPSARFIQWKTILRSGNPAPDVTSVLLYYLPKNVAPDFDDVSVQVGVRYQSLPKIVGVDSGAGANASQPHFDVLPTPQHDRESIAVRWSVHDDNDDQMVYSVYYRGDGQSRWLLLKDNLTDKFYSFDASLLPDGGYTIKVVASDAPSHSPGEALTAEKESARFEVDTTPPQIENLTASSDGGQIHASFRAVDGFSAIKRAEYSLDAAEWQFVEPVGQLSDAKTENYDFRIPLAIADPPASAVVSKTPAAQTEHVVVVRVYDRYDNMSSAKTVIKGK